MYLKKIISVLFILLCLTGTVSAEVSAPAECGYSDNYKNVYIEGRLDDTAERYVAICLKQNNDIKYVYEADVNDDGTYSLKFRYNDGMENCTVSVREGGRGVNSSVTASIIKSYRPEVTINLTNKNNNWYFTDFNDISSVVNVKNKYADEISFDVIAAFYNSGGRLLGFNKCLENINSESIMNFIERPIENVPEGTSGVKAFVWSDTESMIPLSVDFDAQINRYVLGDNYGDEEFVVALCGDSLTHLGISYKKALEHFYMTRYPNRNIKFVNKGISGEWSSNLADRFYDDIMNADGKKPDAAILMVGMNDSGYDCYSDYGRKSDADWHYDNFKENYPKLIDLFTENNIPVVIASSSLYDESNSQALTQEVCRCTEYGANRTGLKRISEFQKQTAVEKGVPYIPVNELTTAYNEEIREKNPEVGTVFTSYDRIHPTNTGAMLIGYLFAEQQAGVSKISEVSIDAEKDSAAAESAVVKNLKADENEIIYDYIADSVPLAVNDEYRRIENVFGYNITEKFNREIIKVIGLSSGSYRVIFDDENELGVFSDEELANGINIAANDNNPAQISARLAYSRLGEKDDISYSERNYQRYILKLKNKNVDMNKVQEGISSLQKTLGLFGELFAAKKEGSGKKEYNPRPLYKRFED